MNKNALQVILHFNLLKSLHQSTLSSMYLEQTSKVDSEKGKIPVHFLLIFALNPQGVNKHMDNLNQKITLPFSQK